MTATLVFSAGTLELRGLQADGVELPPALDWDARTACYRAPALAYAEVVRAMVHGKHPFDDQARAYVELEHGARVRREPRPYQSEGLAAWKKARGRGVVVLPTGAGKSHLAVMAIDDRRRSTLVVAPTLDLVRQWYDLLRSRSYHWRTRSSVGATTSVLRRRSSMAITARWLLPAPVGSTTTPRPRAFFHAASPSLWYGRGSRRTRAPCSSSTYARAWSSNGCLPCTIARTTSA